MIHRTQSLAMTEKLREISPAQSGEFPYTALDADVSLFPDGYSPWHWHDSFEFCTVESGRMELRTQRRSFLLRAGEGCFVNSGVLHSNRALDGTEPLRLHVHQFGGRLIGGGDLAYRRYVGPVESCAALDALTLRGDEPRASEILDALGTAFAAAGEDSFGSELDVAAQLTRAWRGLAQLAAPVIRGAGAVSRDDGGRIKEMLGYIHAHYAESITVADIARSANLGERECFRCFRETLGISPIPYLTRLRVDAAARLLSATGRSVTEIAADCGFSSPSYFCNVFRGIIGKSPREFRKGAE